MLKIIRIAVLTALCSLPAFCAPAFTGHHSEGLYSSGALVSSEATGSISATQGNLLIVYARWSTGTGSAGSTITPTVTDTQSNSYTLVSYVSEGSTERAGMWYTFAGSTSSVNASVGYGSNAVTYTIAMIAEFSGAGALDGPSVKTVINNSGFTLTTPSFSTAATNEIAIMGAQVTSNSPTPDTGYALIGPDTNGIIALQYRVYPSAQSGITATMTSGYQLYTGIIASFAGTTASPALSNIIIF